MPVPPCHPSQKKRRCRCVCVTLPRGLPRHPKPNHQSPQKKVSRNPIPLQMHALAAFEHIGLTAHAAQWRKPFLHSGDATVQYTLGAKQDEVWGRAQATSSCLPQASPWHMVRQPIWGMPMLTPSHHTIPPQLTSLGDTRRSHSNAAACMGLGAMGLSLAAALALATGLSLLVALIAGLPLTSGLSLAIGPDPCTGLGITGHPTPPLSLPLPMHYEGTSRAATNPSCQSIQPIQAPHTTISSATSHLQQGRPGDVAY